MSYDDDDDCYVPRVNYFSSPNVMLYDKPTGGEDADNIRVIELNMVRTQEISTSSDRETARRVDQENRSYYSLRPRERMS